MGFQAGAQGKGRSRSRVPQTLGTGQQHSAPPIIGASAPSGELWPLKEADASEECARTTKTLKSVANTRTCVRVFPARPLLVDGDRGNIPGRAAPPPTTLCPVCRQLLLPLHILQPLPCYPKVATTGPATAKKEECRRETSPVAFKLGFVWRTKAPWELLRSHQSV